jgi:hypothetical protein
MLPAQAATLLWTWPGLDLSRGRTGLSRGLALRVFAGVGVQLGAALNLFGEVHDQR